MFQRLIAVPQEEYLSMTALRNVQNPLSQHFQNLQQQHNEAGKESDENKRLVLQAEALNEMKEVKMKLRESLMTSTPKPYQTRAKALFQNMENILKFNDRGEMIDEHGNVIAQSHIEDLIQHAVRDRRRNITPIGWDSFRDMIVKHNVPRSVLNRNTLDEMMQTTTTIKTEPRDSSILQRNEVKPLQGRPKARVGVKREIKRDSASSTVSRIKGNVKRKPATSPMKLRTKRVKKLDTDFLLNF